MYSREGGQTLLEMVVAMAVVIIVVVALTFTTISSLRNSNYAKNQAQATKYAQEGLEIVRAARDRNQQIISNSGLGSVTSWNGTGNNVCSDPQSIWGYPIDGNCGNSSIGISCYLRIQNNQGVLEYLNAQEKFPDDAEAIPPLPDPPLFNRAIILSDDPSSTCLRKNVTVIVKWTDYAGDHESRLQTILRNQLLP